MKRMKYITIGSLVLLAVSSVAAQSLGDYAREARKNKPATTSPSRHYDNDNLPTGDPLSVVGPASAADANAGQAANAPAASPAATAAERQKAADELKDRLDKQKAKVDALSHELDIDQRELRLRNAAVNFDPDVSARNIQWDKEQAQYRADMDAKQKELDAARQELDDMQGQAHKAGVAVEDKDNDTNKDKDKK
jgi:PAB1-binding protein PBP1